MHGETVKNTAKVASVISLYNIWLLKSLWTCRKADYKMKECELSL